jgi:molybdopterin/thiamine biosynthesis adenylyltransferase
MTALVPTRHLSVINPYNYSDRTVSIIGLGATGSRVFASLVELGLPNLCLFDPDKVEAHNLANQIFLSSHINMFKTDACLDWYHHKTGVLPDPDKLQAFNSYVTTDSINNDDKSPLDIVFLLTDTMASRREIVDALRKKGETNIIIETRMASSYGNIFVFNPNDNKEYKWWKSTLIDDGEAEVSPCGTSISVGPTANIIANLAVWQMICYLVDPSCINKQTNLFLKPLVLGVTL